MANIVNVDYEAIPALARQVRSQAEELNSELVNAYKSIADMHDVWYGVRYNTLVQAFNNMNVEINDLLDLVVRDIPYALETIANNYALADKGAKITSAVQTEPKKIAILATPGDVGMKFLTNEVTATKEKVQINFRVAKEKMELIDATYKKISWQSEAAESFKAKFTKLKNNIVASFENIEVQFSQLMAQTLEDIQASENANTVQ